MASLAAANPAPEYVYLRLLVETLLTFPGTPTLDLVKRIDLDPSSYPYGNSITKGFSWLGWDPRDQSQKNDAVKLHSAYDDKLNMVYFAWREADAKSDTFKLWFDEGDADNVKKGLVRNWRGPSHGLDEKLGMREGG